LYYITKGKKEKIPIFQPYGRLGNNFLKKIKLKIPPLRGKTLQIRDEASVKKFREKF
jgi:hypothetical protein